MCEEEEYLKNVVKVKKLILNQKIRISKKRIKDLNMALKLLEEQEREYILKNPKMAYQINNVRSILMEQLEAEWRVKDKLVLERKQKGEDKINE
jgi:hypothetical protein